jgi:hypothetical protein
VEFALILPVLLISLFVIIELARVLHAWFVIENGARTGVRYAVTGEYNPLNCDSGSSGDDCTISSDENEARVESIHEAAWAGSSSIIRVGENEVNSTDPAFFQVTVCDPEAIQAPSSTFDVHSCPGSEDPGDPGDLVTVILEFNHPLILPGLSTIWPQLRLSARRDATVETFRVIQSSGSPPTMVAPPIIETNTPLPIPTEDIPIKYPECSLIKISGGWGPESQPYFTHRLDDQNVAEGFQGYITWVRVTWPESSIQISQMQYQEYLDSGHDIPGLRNIYWEGNRSGGAHEVTIPMGNLPMYEYAKGRIYFSGVSTLKEAPGRYRIYYRIEYPELVAPCEVDRSIWISGFPTPGPSPTQRPTSPPKAETPSPTYTPVPTTSSPTNTPPPPDHPPTPRD